MGARWYDSRLGRFISPDTVVPDPGNPQDLNRYAYCRNNPLRYSDPSGNTPWDVVDVAFFLWSAKDFLQNPSWANAGWLAADAVSLLPVVPSSGWVRRGAKLVFAATNVGDTAAAIARAVQRVRNTGHWVQRVESMSARAREYQKFVTGTDQVFELGGVAFDAFKADTLIDAKGFYKQFVDKATGEFHTWWKGSGDFVEQARRQLDVAQGAPTTWYFNEEETLTAVRRLFEKEGIEGIELVLKEMP